MARRRDETQRRYLESVVATLTGWNDPQARLQQAFESDEFILYGQSIVPLDPARRLPFHLEILIRLGEEERTLTPPGAFLPMLEHLGMMPVLDRWVIRHAAGWWRARSGVPNTVLNVNLAPETLDSPEFPEFVEQRLRESALPATAMCFELVGSEVAAGTADAIESVRRLKALGCQFAVTGFGRDSISFDALRAVGASIVKMDGSIVREIHRDAVALAKVRSIQGVCSKAGVRTMAEFVEQPETLALLREIGVDFIQGYGVAKPEPLAAAKS
jgi:EAL domain-containing protein (putative c-di-GMP-specific phosphodiesterase class I)